MDIDKLIEVLKSAYIKLRSSLYFEKNNMPLRHQMVEFCATNPNADPKHLAQWILSNMDELDKKLKDIKLFFLPKKFESSTEDKECLICNSYNFNNYKVERLLLYADIPIEFHIISVAWLILFGAKLDKRLYKYCWGNRLVINDDTIEIKEGKHLYKPYQHQYRQWWSKAVDEANFILNDKDDVCMLNLDIKDYYHNIRLDIDKLTNIRPQTEVENVIWKLFVKIHEQYNYVLIDYGIRKDKEYDKWALPVGLPSSYLLANLYLNDFDNRITQNLLPAYYGRYVDDILIVMKSTNKPESTEIFIKEKLSDYITITDNNDSKHYNISTGNEGLELQKDKICLYYFDHNYSTNLLTKFEKEQRERSSEFRFLTDEEDEQFDDEILDFDLCFDSVENEKIRFKPQSEDKFKLSCYLAKFIRRRLDKGKNYKKNKEAQLDKYFQGSILLKHYYFWEKLLVLKIVSEDYKGVRLLYKSIKKEIAKIELKSLDNWIVDKNTLKDNLNSYLDCTLYSALSHCIDENELEQISKELRIDSVICDKYRITHFNRDKYEHRILETLYDVDKDIYIFNDDTIPYNIHFYEIMYALSYNNIVNNVMLDAKSLLEDASILYNKLNGATINWGGIFTSSSPEKYINVIGDNKEQLTIASINQYVSDKSITDSRRNKRVLKSDETETYLAILDNLKKLKEYDMFVMPELSLPWVLLKRYLVDSLNNSNGFVAGMEYLNKNGFVYNCVLTCLPIEINGLKDCIPFFRYKKYYSPHEKDMIYKESFMVPNIEVKNNIFQWKGVCFSVFNCFELTNAPDRALMVGDVDAVIVVAYNKDVKYFDNIAETTSRDLHCYVILTNVSQIGGSQVVAPKTSNYKFLMKIVRGVTEKNQFTIETAELDIKSLRLYQKYQQQDKDKTFKPLPAGYKTDNVGRLKDC